MKMLAMVALVVAAGLAGCEREDVTKGMDPAIDGVSHKSPPVVNMSILEDPKILYNNRMGGAGTGGGTVTVASVPATATSAPATTSAPASAPATSTAPADEATTPPAPPG